MGIVTVKGIEIGSGSPKICVPIMGKTTEDIVRQTKELLNTPADLAEWRADWFEFGEDVLKCIETAVLIRELLGGIPLLVTMRTCQEGGELTITEQAYCSWVHSICDAKCCDMVDIEWFTAGGNRSALFETASRNGIVSVASSHDFEKTPPFEILLERFLQMARSECDISKIAVMPVAETDVLKLLEASCVAEKESGKPVIAISMSELGIMSRICGSFFGSAVTFASAGTASAPGQILAEDMNLILMKIGLK